MVVREYATAISGAAGTITGGAARRGTGGTQDGDHDGVARRRHVPTLAPPRSGRADERAGADPRGNHGSARPPGRAIAMRGHGRLFRRTHSASWWISYYHNGKEIRESARTSSEHKARALLRERLRTAGRPDFIDPTAARRLSFDDLAAMYLTDY